MRVKRAAPLTCALSALGLGLTLPLADGVLGPFARHMVGHMLLVAVAAPALALVCAGTRWDPVSRWTRALSPVTVSFVELVVVWAWHTPAMHHAAGQQLAVWSVEQLSFLLAGFALWIAIVGGASAGISLERAASGVIALVLTFAHMTLLGALFALTPRPLFVHGHSLPMSLDDQQLGGVIMLALSTAVYLPAALWLGAQLLRQTAVRRDTV